MCFLKQSVDKGNLSVLEVELIPFLRWAFVSLETLQTNIDFSSLILCKAPKGLWFYNLARQYSSQMVF